MSHSGASAQPTVTTRFCTTSCINKKSSKLNSTPPASLLHDALQLQSRFANSKQEAAIERQSVAASQPVTITAQRVASGVL